jgi:hypothetical protein
MATNAKLERTDLPGSGWRCISRKACEQRVREIVAAHKDWASIASSDTTSGG